MDGRQRSPSYPSTSLQDAIDIARKLHLVERTNPVERGVAAKALGYSGISGRSATILSNLIQYGLLERAGKSEVRVTRRAVEILYPDTAASLAQALTDAAKEPELFQAIADRFTDGRPSENAIEAFLIRQGYTHTAVRPATRAFLETFLFLENTIGNEGHSQSAPETIEAQQDQQVERRPQGSSASQTFLRAEVLPPSVGKAADQSQGYDVRIHHKRLFLAGTVEHQAEADELIATILALKPMLRAPPTALPPPANKDDDGVFG